MDSGSARNDDNGQRTILHVGPAPVPRPEARKPAAPPPPPPPGVPTRKQVDATAPIDISSPVPIKVGATLPGTRYRIIRELGDGGMGTVYEAEHVDIERRVALKILRPELTRSPEIVEQFRREARAASKVGADQIVQVFDFAELPDGRVLFTMELIEGPTLREELRHGPIPSSRTIGLLRQICKGLDAAHKAGVVHRDVKPDNIVMMRRGRADAIKLLDFGIAAMMGEELRPMSAGTPHYLAPELVAGATFDRRADVYAVGCTAYEMLVGKPPFGRIGHDLDEVLGSHLAEVAEAPSKVRPDLRITPALDRVIMRCLAKLPSNRFRNMGELEAALCAAQIDSSLQTSWDDLPLPDEVDPELRERLLREMPDLHDPLPRRRRWVVPTIAVLSLALGVGATYWWATKRAQQRSAQQIAEVDPIQLLVDEARTAAARSAYVYPTSDDPKGATAYAKVRELEARGDTDAVAAAAGLRAEIAATLAQLGDSYWDLPDGRPFAIEYYTQALIFDREHAHAKARAEVVPDQLDSLAQKAEQLAFTEQEIAAKEPLRRMAQAQESKRVQKPATVAGVTPTPSAGEVAPLGDAPSGDDEEPAASDLPPKPAQVGSDEKAGADDLSKSAAKLLKSGLKADAEEMFKRALTYDPNNALALRSMYEIEAGRGKYDEALEFAERLVANAPGTGGNHVRVGDAAMKLKEYALARRSYERAASLGAKEAATRIEKLNQVSPPPAAADAPAAETKEDSKDPSDAERDDPEDAEPANAKEPAPSGGAAPPESDATSVSQ
ncbi:MAG TPA: protein kinase [Nannocystaceae bacterium]|nr:protein kinase [Nannocystaceae bacterium]